MPGAGFRSNIRLRGHYCNHHVRCHGDSAGHLPHLRDCHGIRNVHGRRYSDHVDRFRHLHQHHAIQRRPQYWPLNRRDRNCTQDDRSGRSFAQLCHVFGLLADSQLGSNYRHRYGYRNWQRFSTAAYRVRPAPRQPVSRSRSLQRYDHRHSHLLTALKTGASMIASRSLAVAKALAAILVIPMTSLAAGAQALAVLPVNILVQPGQKAATLTVTNQGTTETAIQIRAFAWNQPDGADQLTTSDAVVVSPPLASIAAGATQVIRIILRQSPQSSEDTYRILVDQIPPKAEPGVVHIVLRMSIPIFADRKSTRLNS